MRNSRLLQTHAADSLEEVKLCIPEIVRLLRQEQSPDKAHALVYLLRRELGRITHSLGTGTPSSDVLRWADEVIATQLNE